MSHDDPSRVLDCLLHSRVHAVASAIDLILDAAHQVVVTTCIDHLLIERIRSSSDSLNFERLLMPARTHLRGHHTLHVLLQVNCIDHHETLAAPQDMQSPAHHHRPCWLRNLGNRRRTGTRRRTLGQGSQKHGCAFGRPVRPLCLDLPLNCNPQVLPSPNRHAFGLEPLPVHHHPISERGDDQRSLEGPFVTARESHGHTLSRREVHSLNILKQQDTDQLGRLGGRDQQAPTEQAPECQSYTHDGYRLKNSDSR